MNNDRQMNEELSGVTLLPVDQIAIAVLPSKVISAEKSASRFLDLSDTLTTYLSWLKQITVRPSTACRVFNTPYDAASVGFALGVDYVLESWVSGEGGRIRASAQLLRVLDGEPLWREEYDRNARDIAAIENSISNQVARTLRLKMVKRWEKSTQAHAENPELYRKFKIARAFFTEARFDKAINYYKDILKIDKNYALAMAGLAECYQWMGIYNADSKQKTFDLAKFWANSALEQDIHLAQAHTALAYTYMFERNWAKSEEKFNLAIQLNRNLPTPHQGRAHLLTALRRFPEAYEAIERALQIDPFSPIINLVKGFVLYYSGRESLDQFRYTVSLNPRSHASYYSLGLACIQKGLFTEALEAIHKAKRYSHNNEQKRAEEAYLLAILGEKEKASRMLDSLNQESAASYVPPFHIAAIHAQLDELDRAFERLEDSFANDDQWLILLRDDIRFAKLHADPRYEDLIRRLGFPPDEQAS